MDINEFLNRDIDFILSKMEFLSTLKNSTFLITGATGLIGSNIIRVLNKINEKQNLCIKIITLVRNKKKLHSIFPNNEFIIIESDMVNPLIYDGEIDYIIHGASPTQSKYLVDNPVDVIQHTVKGALNIIELARNKNIKSLVYLSSIEVYGQIFDKSVISEQDYGYIDILNPRSCYSEGKRLIECLFKSAEKQYNLPIRIARLTQTIGPGVNSNDNRVFCQFANSALDSKDIILHTTGFSSKSYVYTLDAVHAILRIMVFGNKGEAYNVSNNTTYISISDLAEFIRKEFNPNIKITYDIVENNCYAPDTKINLDTNKLNKIGWVAFYDLKMMFTNLIKYLEYLKK